MKKKDQNSNSEPSGKFNPNQQQFSLPESILKQLNEFSEGGFILCRIGPNGSPEVYVHYDDTIKALGLVKYLAAWAGSVDNLNDETIYNSIRGQIEGGEDED